MTCRIDVNTAYHVARQSGYRQEVFPALAEVPDACKTCSSAKGAGRAGPVQPVGQCDAVQGSSAQRTGVEGPVRVPGQVG